MHSVAERLGVEQAMLIEAVVSIKAMLVRMLSRMEARGLVRREHDSADKRHRFVYPTEQGEMLLSHLIPQGNETGGEFLGCLSDGKREQLTRLVRKMMTP